MEKYPWSANVRQLDSAVCNMMLRARGDIVNPSDFDEYLKDLAAQSGSVAPIAQNQSMRQATDQMIREQIIGALKVSRTQLETAAKLGIDRSKLIRDLKRLGIDPKAYLFKP
jgi:DNA-binding NtrC family response regulator